MNNKVVRSSVYRSLLPRIQWRFRHLGGPPQRLIHNSLKTHRPSHEAELECEQRSPSHQAHQASIVTKHPIQTTVKDIVGSLRRDFRMSGKLWKEFSKRASPLSHYNQALVILATPSYAQWLQDGNFIPLVLEAVIPPIEDSNKNAELEWPFRIDVVCACVDGLPPTLEGIPQQNAFHIAEGFSVLHGRADEIIPEIWEPELTKVGDSPGMQSSLTFSRQDRTSQVTLPLANTLFKNGQNSTLLVSRWVLQQNLDERAYKRIRSKEKSNQLINVFEGDLRGTPSSSMSVVPLTPARKIISGLGNIVRQIEFDDDVGPASRELEVNVDEYLRVMGCQQSTVKVWALVIPFETLPDMPPEPPNDLLLDEDAIKKLWQDPTWRLSTWQNPRHRSSFVGHWIDRGATLCRVLSGGGGWGIKQGLLSLDPQTTYEIPSEARFDFSAGSIEEQQESALGSIAHPNALIQFFVSPHDAGVSPAVSILSGNSHGLRTSNPFQRETVIGAVPSTIDDIPAPEISYPSSPNEKNEIFYRQGHFGAVSESGMYYSSTLVKATQSEQHITAKTPISTKIDVPYSFFFRDYQKKDKPQSIQIDKYKSTNSNPTDVTEVKKDE